MKQSRMNSLIESVGNVAIGFFISLGAQIVLLPMLGVAISLSQNFAFAVLMTVISIARSYALRRLFEALHIRRPLSPAMQAVLAERYRQIEAEGWSLEHDDEHSRGELARAGAVYALPDDVLLRDVDGNETFVPRQQLWLWDIEWFKPQDFRRNLVRGCALILAELERFDRARRKKAPATAPQR